MKSLESLTDEQRDNIRRFAKLMFQSAEVYKALIKRTDAEIGELLMHLTDDMEIGSPQATLIEVAAERLGYAFDDRDGPGPQGFKFGSSVCHDCGATVKDNWIVRHMKSGCKIGGR